MSGTAIFRLRCYTYLICGCWHEANVSASKITVYRGSARVWRVEISYLWSIVGQRPGDGDLDYGSAWCGCTGRDQTSMVWLTVIQYLHVLAVQRSLTVVRPSTAFHDSTCEYRVMFAIFSTVVANGTCTKTGSRERLMALGADRRRQWCSCSQPINTSPKTCGKTSCYMYMCVGKCLDRYNVR